MRNMFDRVVLFDLVLKCRSSYFSIALVPPFILCSASPEVAYGKQRIKVGHKKLSLF
jgi:hypothetical protein